MDASAPPDLLEILDIVQLFQLVDERIFDKSVHFQAARITNLLDRLFDAGVNPRRELCLSHVGISLTYKKLAYGSLC